jgi:hypothetical protein
MKALKARSLGQARIAALVVLTALQGCGDDSDANPTPPDVTAGGSSSKAGSANKAGTAGKAGSSNNNTEGGTTSDGGKPSQGGSGNEGNEGGEGPIPQPTCDLPELGEDGCFNCPKNADEQQWLNRCADSDCVPFDNQARLPLLNEDGSLPELP